MLAERVREWLVIKNNHHVYNAHSDASPWQPSRSERRATTNSPFSCAREDFFNENPTKSAHVTDSMCIIFSLPKWRTFCLCSFCVLHVAQQKRRKNTRRLVRCHRLATSWTCCSFACNVSLANASIHSIVELKGARRRKWRLLLVIDDYKVICIRSEWRGDNCIIQYPFECKLNSFEEGFCAIKLSVTLGSGSFFKLQWSS